MKFKTLLLTGALIMASSYQIGAHKITPVTGFSLEKYLGTWYEIARMPFKYENGLSAITATYSMRDDGKVSVVNKGIKAGGKESVARGKAKFASSPDVGHLKVSFFLWFYADYIIADLDPAYQWALVVSPPKYFWILCRMPQLDRAVLTRLVNRAAALGYDTSKVIISPQGRPDAQ
ncbi:MAG: lipocalin family protein [Chitinispirillaceae bacterium]|nr:lipocalin family protein [Chitinispirillaceae bacterium]